MTMTDTSPSQVDDGANVPDAERWLSGLAGGGLVLWGLRRRTPVGALLAGAGSYLIYRGASGQCAFYRALGAPAAQPGDPIGAPLWRGTAMEPVTIERSVTVNRPLADVREFWSQPANLARVLPMLESVTPVAEGRTRWVTRGPAGRTFTWETDVVESGSPDRITWRSAPGGDLMLTSEARFTPAPGNRGTEIHLRVTVEPPGGVLGGIVARLASSSPAAPLGDALRRLKQLLETGEIPTTVGQPRGQGDWPTPPALVRRSSAPVTSDAPSAMPVGMDREASHSATPSP